MSYRSDSESDGEYMDAAETGHFPDRSGGQRTDFAGRNESSPSQTRRNDAAPRRRWGDGDRRARPEYGPCAACGDSRHSAHKSSASASFVPKSMVLDSASTTDSTKRQSSSSSRNIRRNPFLLSSKASISAI
ncbi:unnamed protein product [Phytophthora lilii]|uniref:Unnamed protein product n=1 Tax=Phytophthora lilii TaxID=2077276 RepID=A0A9W6X4W2_9STRA|nr:unnamed protein product [Phytophthora lilii]